MISIDEVNRLESEAFVARFGGVFEKSPHVAAAVWQLRPFRDRKDLSAAFDDIVEQLDDDEAIELLRSYPTLADSEPMDPESRTPDTVIRKPL